MDLTLLSRIISPSSLHLRVPGHPSKILLVEGGVTSLSPSELLRYSVDVDEATGAGMLNCSICINAVGWSEVLFLTYDFMTHVASLYCS